MDPADIHTTPDPDRVYGPWPGVLLELTESAAAQQPGPWHTPTPAPAATGASERPPDYRFIVELSQGDTFALLGPCPACAGEVPVARVTSLADFGNFLDGQPEPTVEFPHDRGHAPHCVRATRDEPGT